MCTVAISYAWTSDAYEARVQSLATRLRSDGIYVILDKWELRFGNDVYAFMERLVADPNISFVLILCNSEYERKANARCGGAGTEAGLIAPTISGASRQTKYVPVLMERRPDNTPHIPAFLLGRLFADLSTPGSEAAEYAKILNHIRTTPSDQTDTPLPATPTSIVSANRPSHNQSSPSLTNELATALKTIDNSGSRGQAAVNMIARLLPIRNRFMTETFQALSSQREQDDTQLLADKIEQLLDAIPNQW